MVPEPAIEGMEAPILSRLEIEKNGFIHAVGRDPGLDLLLGRVFPELFPGDGLGRGENIEEQKGHQADPDHGGDG